MSDLDARRKKNRTRTQLIVRVIPSSHQIISGKASSIEDLMEMMGPKEFCARVNFESENTNHDDHICRCGRSVIHEKQSHRCNCGRFFHIYS